MVRHAIPRIRVRPHRAAHGSPQGDEGCERQHPLAIGCRRPGLHGLAHHRPLLRIGLSLPARVRTHTSAPWFSSEPSAMLLLVWCWPLACGLGRQQAVGPSDTANRCRPICGEVVGVVRAEAWTPALVCLLSGCPGRHVGSWARSADERYLEANGPRMRRGRHAGLLYGLARIVIPPCGLLPVSPAWCSESGACV